MNSLRNKADTSGLDPEAVDCNVGQSRSIVLTATAIADIEGELIKLGKNI